MRASVYRDREGLWIGWVGTVQGTVREFIAESWREALDCCLRFMREFYMATGRR